MKDILVKVNRSESRDRFFDGYKDGDPLETALSIQVYNAGLASPDDDDLAICEKVFAALNAPFFSPVGNLTEQDIKEYHREYPSLSVGDVVQINGQPYACEGTGWRKLERPKEPEWVWLPAKDVAKIARKVLKKTFPDVKFSVRTHTYAGGASIDVSWWDGPRAQDVERHVKHLQSVSHMDITDLVHHKNSVHEGKDFHSGANYIFCKRLHSKAFLERITKQVIHRDGLDVGMPEIRESEWGAHLTGDVANKVLENTQRSVTYGGEFVTLAELVERAARERPSMGFDYSDDPDTYEWTSEDGEKVSSTYFHGKVRSKVNGKTKSTDSIDSNEWQKFKANVTSMEKN